MNNIKKSFGDLTVLQDISMQVNEGEVISIIGPSGSGKSTFLRCATFLETIDSGEINYMGTKAAWTGTDGKAEYLHKNELRKVKSWYGLVFQQFNLFPHYTVLKNLMDAPIHIQKRDKKEVEEEARALLKRMGGNLHNNIIATRISHLYKQILKLHRVGCCLTCGNYLVSYLILNSAY